MVIRAALNFSRDYFTALRLSCSWRHCACRELICALAASSSPFRDLSPTVSSKGASTCWLLVRIRRLRPEGHPEAPRAAFAPAWALALVP